MRAAMTWLAALLVAGSAQAQQTVVHPRSRIVPREPARATSITPQPAADSSAGRANSGLPLFAFPCCSAYYYAYLPYGPALPTYVHQAPPPAIPEAVGPAPAPAMAWIPGFWAWTGSAYNWVEGRWALIPAPYSEWVPGSWAANQLGYYWVPGYWR